MTMDLDETDRRLLSLLNDDARQSQRQLARQLGVAQGTVTNRIKRLEEAGVISGYSAVLNPEQIGWSMTIMAGLRIVKGSMIDVQQKIAADPRVFAVYDVTGDWDSMVLARVKDREDLDNLAKPFSRLRGSPVPLPMLSSIRSRKIRSHNLLNRMKPHPTDR